MPELPEVEIAARNLRSWARGARIVDEQFPKSRVIRGSRVEGLVGRVLKSVDRRGKWLRIVLDDDTRVFSHLGMSGRWVRRKVDDETERWERGRLDVERRGKRTSLRYVDPRMFGRIAVSRDDLDEWVGLGPDPLVDGLDGPTLREAIGARRRSIKEVLMDQTVIAGVGNIQATEALWRARIDPRAAADSLSPRRIGQLARAIHWTITRTLELEEGPEIQYVEDAGAPNPFVVYGREGEPCPRCRTPLTRIVLGGRSTVFCGTCQA